MTDIQKMSGTFSEPENENGQMVLSGSAPVSQMQGYAAEMTAYTRGLGHLSCTLKGYGPCGNGKR